MRCPLHRSDHMGYQKRRVRGHIYPVCSGRLLSCFMSHSIAVHIKPVTRGLARDETEMRLHFFDNPRLSNRPDAPPAFRSRAAPVDRFAEIELEEQQRSTVSKRASGGLMARGKRSKARSKPRRSAMRAAWG